MCSYWICSSQFVDERDALDALLDLGNLTPDLFHTSASEAG